MDVKIPNDLIDSNGDVAVARKATQVVSEVTSMADAAFFQAQMKRCREKAPQDLTA
eukprot:SAG31_NODE_13261_length_881_cov_11.663683_2_plen_56_part_00